MTRFLPILALTLLVGCDSPVRMNKESSSGFRVEVNADRPAPGAKDGAPGAAGAKPEEPGVERKVIHSAAIELVVTNVEAIQPQVEKVVADYKGYVAKSDVTGQAGVSRSATWTLKVPVADYRAAVARLVALGQLVRNTSDSHDVTEEFVDLTARVKNFKAEEETLNKLLKDTAIRLDDILKIREQIKIVRGEIERAEGRLKYLGLVTALSTITLQAREETPYLPETPTAAATFGEQIDTRFTASWNSLVGSGKAFVLGVVEVAPFLPFYLVGGAVAIWAGRRLYRWLRHNAFVPLRDVIAPPTPGTPPE